MQLGMEVVSMASAVVLNEAPHNMVEKGLAVLSRDKAGNPLVTKADFGRNVINDPFARAHVINAMQGNDRITTITPAMLLEREGTILEQLFELVGSTPPKQLACQIKRSIEQVGNAAGQLTEHQRYLPGGLVLISEFDVLTAFQVANPDFKLLQTPGQEDWRGWLNVTWLPTQAGMLTCDFSQVLRPTDLKQRPFRLTQAEHHEWALAQGGDGLTSVEELVHLYLRSLLETGLPLWSGPAIRCRNANGSGQSLCVDSRAGHGFSVCSSGHDAHWTLGAVARKFQPLAA
jgi:hypothetical protein